MSDALASARPVLDRFRLDGKVALVTGGGQGIGRAFAHALAEAGASVGVVDVNEGAAETVARELAAKGAQAVAVVADVTDARAVTRMVSEVRERLGGLTIAVNNAGITAFADAEVMAQETWRGIMNLNLDGVFLCAQAEARVMLASGYGKIINTASISGHISNTPQHQCAYNTSKAAVLHLTRTLAAEWASRGVRVNSISPGYTRTLLVDAVLATPEGKALLPQWMTLVPMGRMAEVTDLQGAVVYLASELSDYMTGADIVIDGGYCAW